MIPEEIVINNSTLYENDKPYFYRGISLSDIILHKLAGYNGMMHAYSNAIIRAEKQYKKKTFLIKLNKQEFDLQDIIIYNQHKQDSSFFLVRSYEKSLSAFQESLNNYYNSESFVPLELNLKYVEEYSYDLTSHSKNAYIFLATMNNYLNPMIPVMHELLSNNKNVIILLPRDAVNWTNYSKLIDYEIIFIEDLLSKDIKQNFDNINNNIESLFKNSLKTFKKNVKYKRIKCFDVFQRNYQEVYCNYIPHVCAYIDICENLITSLKPKAFFIARLRRSVEISFNEVFKRNNISTNMLIHGHIDDADERFFTDGYFDSVSRIFAWDNIQKDKLLGKKYQSVKPENIYVCGNPAWDEIVYRRENNLFLNKKEIQKKLNIQNDYLLLISQGYNIEGYRRAIKTIIDNTDYLIVVKIHPNEDENRYNDYLNNGRIVLVKNCIGYDLHSLIHNSELVLTHSSTVNLESIYCGKTVVTLLFDEFNSYPILYDMKYFNMPEVSNEKELIQLLNSSMVYGNCNCNSHNGYTAKKICNIVCK